MRSNITCSVTNQPNALAAIYYPNANTSSRPVSTAWTTTSTSCGNDPLSSTTPIYPITPNPSPGGTTTVAITGAFNSTGHFVWEMNGSTFRGDYNDPLLLLAKTGNTSYPYDPEWNVYNFGSNKTFRIIVNNNTPVPHPMHMHGHNMFVLAEGTGTWDGTVVNPSNPQRRDVQLLQGNGYLVFQLNADNPGVWPFHCHIAWHVSGGLYLNVLERPADIKNLQIPSTLAQSCRDWATYTGTHVVDQIDSGL